MISSNSGSAFAGEFLVGRAGVGRCGFSLAGFSCVGFAFCGFRGRSSDFGRCSLSRFLLEASSFFGRSFGCVFFGFSRVLSGGLGF